MKSLKATIAGFLALTFFALTAFTGTPADDAATAKSWSVDKAHSSLSFEVRHFFTPVSGKFDKYSADINFDPENLSGSSIAVDIKVNSINTENRDRDDHLLSPDFFNAEEYPKITFRSDRITREGDNKFVAHGKLTIKGVTRDVKLPFTLLGIQDNPFKEGTLVAGIKSNLSIDRTEYGVGVGDWAATAVVGDEVSINIALELNASK